MFINQCCYYFFLQIHTCCEASTDMSLDMRNNGTDPGWNWVVHITKRIAEPCQTKVETKISQWVSVTTLPKSSVLYHFDMMLNLRYPSRGPLICPKPFFPGQVFFLPWVFPPPPREKPGSNKNQTGCIVQLFSLLVWCYSIVNFKAQSASQFHLRQSTHFTTTSCFKVQYDPGY